MNTNRSTNSQQLAENRTPLPAFIAMETLVVEPIAERMGILPNDVSNEYDLDFIFVQVLTFDSINGQEGFLLNPDVPEDKFWEIVALCKI